MANRQVPVNVPVFNTNAVRYPQVSHIAWAHYREAPWVAIDNSRGGGEGARGIFIF
jgi:hypothetical protein